MTEEIRTGKDMAKIFASNYNPEKLSTLMSNFVNSYSCDTKGFIEGLQQLDDNETDIKKCFTDICFYWFKKLAYFNTHNFYDLRNEYSVKTATKLLKALESNNLLPHYITSYTGESKGSFDLRGKPVSKDISPELIFVEQMSRDHRTLQQTFSGITFRWVATLQDPKLQQALTPITADLGDDFYHTPMI